MQSAKRHSHAHLTVRQPLWNKALPAAAACSHLQNDALPSEQPSILSSVAFAPVLAEMPSSAFGAGFWSRTFDPLLSSFGVADADLTYFWV